MIDNLDPAELYIQYDNKTILVYYLILQIKRKGWFCSFKF